MDGDAETQRPRIDWRAQWLTLRIDKLKQQHGKFVGLIAAAECPDSADRFSCCSRFRCPPTIKSKVVHLSSYHQSNRNPGHLLSGDHAPVSPFARSEPPAPPEPADTTEPMRPPSPSAAARPDAPNLPRENREEPKSEHHSAAKVPRDVEGADDRPIPVPDWTELPDPRAGAPAADGGFDAREFAAQEAVERLLVGGGTVDGFDRESMPRALLAGIRASGQTYDAVARPQKLLARWPRRSYDADEPHVGDKDIDDLLRTFDGPNDSARFVDDDYDSYRASPLLVRPDS